MSVQNALQFIKQFRSNEELRNKLLAMKDNQELEAFVKLGNEVGLNFTVEHLQTAHKHDWGLRWLLHNR